MDRRLTVRVISHSEKKEFVLRRVPLEFSVDQLKDLLHEGSTPESGVTERGGAAGGPEMDVSIIGSGRSLSIARSRRHPIGPGGTSTQQGGGDPAPVTPAPLPSSLSPITQQSPTMGGHAVVSPVRGSRVGDVASPGRQGSAAAGEYLCTDAVATDIPPPLMILRKDGVEVATERSTDLTARGARMVSPTRIVEEDVSGITDLRSGAARPKRTPGTRSTAMQDLLFARQVEALSNPVFADEDPLFEVVLHLYRNHRAPIPQVPAIKDRSPVSKVLPSPFTTGGTTPGLGFSSSPSPTRHQGTGVSVSPASTLQSPHRCDQLQHNSSPPHHHRQVAGVQRPEQEGEVVPEEPKVVTEFEDNRLQHSGLSSRGASLRDSSRSPQKSVEFVADDRGSSSPLGQVEDVTFPESPKGSSARLKDPSLRVVHEWSATFFPNNSRAISPPAIVHVPLVSPSPDRVGKPSPSANNSSRRAGSHGSSLGEGDFTVVEVDGVSLSPIRERDDSHVSPPRHVDNTTTTGNSSGLRKPPLSPEASGVASQPGSLGRSDHHASNLRSPVGSVFSDGPTTAVGHLPELEESAHTAPPSSAATRQRVVVMQKPSPPTSPLNLSGAAADFVGGNGALHAGLSPKPQGRLAPQPGSPLQAAHSAAASNNTTLISETSYTIGSPLDMSVQGGPTPPPLESGEAGNARPAPSHMLPTTEHLHGFVALAVQNSQVFNAVESDHSRTTAVTGASSHVDPHAAHANGGTRSSVSPAPSNPRSASYSQSGRLVSPSSASSPGRSATPPTNPRNQGDAPVPASLIRHASRDVRPASRRTTPPPTSSVTSKPSSPVPTAAVASQRSLDILKTSTVVGRHHSSRGTDGYARSPLISRPMQQQNAPDKSFGSWETASSASGGVGPKLSPIPSPKARNQAGINASARSMFTTSANSDYATRGTNGSSSDLRHTMSF